MAIENPDEIFDIIREIIDQQRRGVAISDDSLRRLAAAANTSTASLDSLKKAATGAKSAFNNIGQLGSSALSGSTSLKSFNGMIDAAGNVISGLLGALGPLGRVAGFAVEGLSEVAQVSVSEFDRLHTAFQVLSRAGAAGADGMMDVREQARALGMPFTDMARMIAKNTERLAGLAGTTADASSQMTRYLGIMKQQNDSGYSLDQQLRQLGFGSEEITDTFMQFADIQRRFAGPQSLTQERLINGSIRYGQELDALAKLTGARREDLRAEREQLLTDQRFAAKLRQMRMSGDEALIRAADELEAGVIAVGRTMGKDTQRAVMQAATGYLTGPEAQKATVTLNGFYGMVQQLAGPGGSAETFLQGMHNSARAAEPLTNQMGLMVGEMSPLLNSLEVMNGATRGFNNELGEARQQVRDSAGQIVTDSESGTKTMTQTVTQAFRDFERTGAELGYLATRAEFAAKTIGYFSEQMASATQKLNDYLNQPGAYGAPPTSTEQAARALGDIRDTNQVIADHISGVSPLPAEKVDDLKASLDDLRKSIDTQIGGLLSKPGGMTQVDQNVYVDLIREKRRLEQRLAELEKAPTAAPTSATPAPATAPAIAPLETPQQGARGAIMTGPESGYRATLHGTEAVVPLQGDRTIPVEIRDNRDSSASLKMMEAQISKLDSMIDAIKQNTAVNEKILRTSYN